MSTLTAERIAELRRLRRNVTPGSLGWSTAQNAECVSATFNALPDLLDAAERVIALEAACKRKDALLLSLAEAGDNCAVSQADVESAREEVGKR